MRAPLFFTIPSSSMFQTVIIVIVFMLQPSIRATFDQAPLAAISAALSLGTSVGNSLRTSWGIISGMAYTATACTVLGYTFGNSVLATAIFMPIVQLVIGIAQGRLIHPQTRRFFIAFTALQMINTMINKDFSVAVTWKSVVSVAVGSVSAVVATIFPLRVSASYNLERRGHRSLAASARLLHVLIRGFISVLDPVGSQLTYQSATGRKQDNKPVTDVDKSTDRKTTEEMVADIRRDAARLGGRDSYANALSRSPAVEREKAKARLQDLERSDFTFLPGEREELARAAGLSLTGSAGQASAHTGPSTALFPNATTKPSVASDGDVELGLAPSLTPELSALADPRPIMQVFDDQHSQFSRFESQIVPSPLGTVNQSSPNTIPQMSQTPASRPYYSPSTPVPVAFPESATATVEEENATAPDAVHISTVKKAVRFPFPSPTLSSHAYSQLDEGSQPDEDDDSEITPLNADGEQGDLPDTLQKQRAIENFEVTPAPFTRLFIMEANALIQRIEQDVEACVAALPDLEWESFLYRLMCRIFCCLCFRRKHSSRDGIDPEYPPFMSIARQPYAPYSPPSVSRFLSEISAITSNARGMLSALSALERISPSGHALHVKFVDRLRDDLVAVSQEFHSFIILLISKQCHPSISDLNGDASSVPANKGSAQASTQSQAESAFKPSDTMPLSAFSSQNVDESTESNVAVLQYEEAMATCATLWFNYSFLRRELFFPSTIRRYKARLAKQQKAMQEALIHTLQQLVPSDQGIGSDNLETIDMRAAFEGLDEDANVQEDEDDTDNDTQVSGQLTSDEKAAMATQAVGKQQYKVQDVLAISHFFFNLDHILSRAFHHVAPICLPVLTDFAHRVSTTPAALAFPDDLPPDLDHLSATESAQAQAKVLTSALGVTMGPEFATAAAGAIQAERQRQNRQQQPATSTSDELPPEYADYLWSKRRRHNRLDFTRNPPPDVFALSKWVTFFAPNPLLLLFRMIRSFFYPPVHKPHGREQTGVGYSSPTTTYSTLSSVSGASPDSVEAPSEHGSYCRRLWSGFKCRCQAAVNEIPHEQADIDYYKFIVKLVAAIMISATPEFVKGDGLFSSGAWAPLTVGMIMGDNVGSTLINSLQRFVGTVAGAILGYVAILLALDAGEPHSQQFVVTLGAVLAAWAFLLGYIRASSRHGYAASVGILTPFIVALGHTELSFESAKSLAMSRIEMTLFAIIVMVVISFVLWPVRAQTQALCSVSKVLKESITCLELNVYLLEASALAAQQAERLELAKQKDAKTRTSSLSSESSRAPTPSIAAHAPGIKPKSRLSTMFSPTGELSEVTRSDSDARETSNSTGGNDQVATTSSSPTSTLRVLAEDGQGSQDASIANTDPLAQLRQRFIALFPGAAAPHGPAFMYAFDTAMEQRLAQMRSMVSRQVGLALDAVSEPTLCRQSVHVNLLYDAITAQRSLIRVLARMQECIFMHQWLQRHVPKSTFRAAYLKSKGSSKPKKGSAGAELSPTTSQTAERLARPHLSYQASNDSSLSTYNRVSLGSAAFPREVHPTISSELAAIDEEEKEADRISGVGLDLSQLGGSPFDLSKSRSEETGALRTPGSGSKRPKGSYPDFVELALAACKLLVVLLHDVNRQIEVSSASLFTCTTARGASGDSNILKAIEKQYKSQRSAAEESLHQKKLEMYRQNADQGLVRKPSELMIVTVDEGDTHSHSQGQDGSRKSETSVTAQTRRSLRADVPVIIHSVPKNYDRRTSLPLALPERTDTRDHISKLPPNVDLEALHYTTIQLLYPIDDAEMESFASATAKHLVELISQPRAHPDTFSPQPQAQFNHFRSASLTQVGAPHRRFLTRSREIELTPMTPRYELPSMISPTPQEVARGRMPLPALEIPEQGPSLSPSTLSPTASQPGGARSSLRPPRLEHQRTAPPTPAAAAGTPMAGQTEQLPQMFTPLAPPAHLAPPSARTIATLPDMPQEVHRRVKLHARAESYLSTISNISQRIGAGKMATLADKLTHQTGMTRVAEGLNTVSSLFLPGTPFVRPLVSVPRARSRSIAEDERPKNILGLVWGDGELLEDDDIWLTKSTERHHEGQAPQDVSRHNPSNLPTKRYVIRRDMGGTYRWESISRDDALVLVNTGKFAYYTNVPHIPTADSRSIRPEFDFPCGLQPSEEQRPPKLGRRTSHQSLAHTQLDPFSDDLMANDAILNAFIQRVDLAARLEGVDTTALEAVSMPMQRHIYQVAGEGGELVSVDLGVDRASQVGTVLSTTHVSVSADETSPRSPNVNQSGRTGQGQPRLGKGATVSHELQSLALKLDNQSAAVYEWATERIRIGQLFNILSEIVKHYDESCALRISRTHPKGDPMIPSLFLLTEHAFIYSTTTLSKVLLDLTLAIRALHLSANVWLN